MDEFYHIPGSKKYWFIGGGIAFLILLIGFLIYFRLYLNKTGPQEVPATLPITSGAPGSLESRMSTLENAVAILINRVNNLGGGTSPSTTPTATSDNAQIQALQATVASLQAQINQLQGSSGSSSGANAPGTVAYIPLGWTGSATTTTYTQITGQTFTINTANYPGYTSMQFQVNLQIYQGNGTAYAQLFDVTDGIAIPASTVSTTSQDYTWVSSSNFQLPAGSKSYIMQLSTNTTYASNVQNARIQVNF